jgi:hypothetical protein
VRELPALQYTTKLPPPKRAKANSPAAQLQKQLAAANAGRTLGGKPGGWGRQVVQPAPAVQVRHSLPSTLRAVFKAEFRQQQQQQKRSYWTWLGLHIAPIYADASLHVVALPLLFSWPFPAVACCSWQGHEGPGPGQDGQGSRGQQWH